MTFTLELETDRLLIKEYVPEDIEDVHLYASDPFVVEHMIWGPNSEEETRSFIHLTIDMQRQVPRQGFELAVVMKTNNKLIGGCGIHTLKPSQGEIGYCFNREYWGNGFASEATSALLKFGFQNLGLHRIYATCRPQNIGSARVMQKNGMVYEGHLREHMWHKGKWHDSYQYSIIKGEYS